MMNNLYQKKHGLPGLSNTKGIDGKDGAQGYNIYFGNIQDFFDSVEVEVDSLIRVAQNKQGTFYSGVFTKTNGEYIDQSEGIIGNSYSNGSFSVPDNNKNIFQQIYNIPDFRSSERYGYSYDDETEENLHYTKVNMADVSSTKFGIKWADDTKSGMTDTVMASDRTQPNPYKTYDIDDKVDYMPGHIAVGRIDGFRLFYIEDGDSNYTYSTDNERYSVVNPAESPYSDFNEPGSWYSMDSSKSVINPTTEKSLRDIIEWFREGNTQGMMNYVKYNAKMIQKVVFASNLKEDIKAGDVIYFYTDVNRFEYDNTVEYMVVITPALERCTLKELIAAASITKPFMFKYIDELQSGSDSFITTSNKVTAVYYDGDNSDIYGKNFANYITYSSESVVNIGNLVQTDIDNGFMMSLADSDGATFEICPRSNNNTEYEINIDTRNADDDIIPIKMTETKFKNHNIGNIETKQCLEPAHIYLSNGFCYTLEEGDFNYLDNIFTISMEKYLLDTSYDNFTCGALIIIYDNSKVEDFNDIYGSDNEYVTIKKLVFGTSDAKFKIEDKYGENTVYMIQIWIEEPGSMRRYSRHTIAKWNTDINGFAISVLEDNNADEIEDSVETNVEFVSYGVSPDRVDNAKLDIYIPCNVLNPGTSSEEHIIPTNIQLFVNSHTDIMNGGSYYNSWFNINNFIEDDEADREAELRNGKYVYHIGGNMSMSDNIPQIISDVDATTAREYNSLAGSDTKTDGCDLFNALLDNKTVSTASRSVLLTLKYNIGSKEYKTHYKLIQPGFKEKRAIPKIDLSIDKELTSLEKANQVGNGVMCNQFQFFVNVDISDFSAENWGSYLADDEITLNMTIKNTPSDYEFIEKYSVESGYETYTIHANAVDNITDFGSNYVSINTYLIDNDIKDPYNKSQKQLDESHIQIISNLLDSGTSDVLSKAGETYKYTDDNNIEIKKTVVSDPETLTAAFGTPYERSSGINDSISVDLRNITFKNAANGRYRFRVVVEYANPVFSRLFFRFYVSDLYVKYGSSPTAQTFHIGTNNLAKMKQAGRMTTYDYMYATDTLNVFVCPVSMTAIPDELYPEMEYYKNNDNVVKMYGPDDQIKVQIDKYVPEITQLTDAQKLEFYTNEQIVPWSEFGLKKRYFQDNLKNLVIEPVHIMDMKDKLSVLEIINNNPDDNHTMNTDMIDKYESIVKDDQYMSVMFNALYYSPMRRNDVLSFYYNDALYSANKYSQYANDAPVFTKQDLEYEVRSQQLLNAVNVWNHEYKISSDKNDNLFFGINNLYGNGYEYLSDDSDTGQYTAKETLTLAETKEQNEEYIFDAPYSINMWMPSMELETQPDAGKWFRQLLYQLVWRYPKHYIDNASNVECIAGYDLVDNRTFVTNTTGSGTDIIDKHVLPYNLAYTIYPRCAYDDEHDTAIVMMLRTPSVCEENKYRMLKSDFMFDTSMESDNKTGTISNNPDKYVVIS